MKKCKATGNSWCHLYSCKPNISEKNGYCDTYCGLIPCNNGDVDLISQHRSAERLNRVRDFMSDRQRRTGIDIKGFTSPSEAKSEQDNAVIDVEHNVIKEVIEG